MGLFNRGDDEQKFGFSVGEDDGPEGGIQIDVGGLIVIGVGILFILFYGFRVFG